ncbi:MAG: SsrA-binding protein [Candidatus Anoxychlamydiales bacterium]|nr:SsrA-binding protein [Candidatus Anoxychlamydiales bacterium]
MKDLVSNKKAFHDYEILQTYEAGIVLKGSEIKSLKNYSGSLQDSYVDIKNDELWLMNSYIAPYTFATTYVHKERRKRKLLMHKSEISKIKKQMQEKGIALIPIAIYLKKAKAKVKIALARGKKAYDKRAKLKEKAQKREIRKATKF